MTTVTLKGNPIHTSGQLPAVGQPAPDFTLTGVDLKELSRADFAGRWVVLNIFPSIDTPTCAASVRRFNEEAAGLTGTAVLCISADLPFAAKRFCGAEGIEKVSTLSSFRHPEFAERYGVKLVDGPLAGLMARAIVVIDAAGVVRHTELVSEIAQEPNYQAALAAM
jgi:thiol peroxidase